jgi:hypothetical protein
VVKLFQDEEKKMKKNLINDKILQLSERFWNTREGIDTMNILEWLLV